MIMSCRISWGRERKVVVRGLASGRELIGKG